MFFADIEESKAVQRLRDTLATLKWELWEHLPQGKRADIPDDYYEKFVQERLAECAGFTKELVEGRMFRDEEISLYGKTDKNSKKQLEKRTKIAKKQLVYNIDLSVLM